jgi:hypothetical protein
MKPGEALDAQDVYYRLDGSVGRHHGARRINATAFSGRGVGHKGFPYKGKNSASARLGNFGIANDAGSATPSRRASFYSTAVIVTDNNEIRFWNPSTLTYDLPTLNINGRGAGVWLPTGVTSLPLEPKPSFEVHNDNLYIVGLGANLRYDPVDRGLYLWGWENTPTINGVVTTYTPAGTSDLIDGATYKYRASWIDLYTGEESKLSEPYEVKISGNQGVDFGGAPASGVNIVDYAGDRHWAPPADLPDSDVGVVIYRTAADGEKYYFLGVIYPSTAAATTWSDGTALVDDGLATDESLPGVVKEYEDPPVLNCFIEHIDMWWGASWDTNWGRLYFNDFEGENSFWERWDPRQYKNLPFGDGEFITAVSATNKSVVPMSNYDAYEIHPTPTVTGRIEKPVRKLKWDVGAVGPKAHFTLGGTIYFISDRGPYRWRSGMQKPQWIGKSIQSLFIDAESDLCQLNAEGRMETEIGWDLDVDVLRMCFACGPNLVPNRHLTYSTRTAEMNQRPDRGYAFMSSKAQCFDLTNTLVGLRPDGAPVKPWERRAKTVFCDGDGFVYEYDTGIWTYGLAGVSQLTGAVQAGSTQSSIVTLGGLYTGGDDLVGCWVEIVYSDGDSEMRRIASNNATTIVPVVPFSESPVGGTWYVGGYPSYWESWVDHMGDPHTPKKLKHIHVGFNAEETGSSAEVDVTIKASKAWPAQATHEKTVNLSNYRGKKLINWVGVFFTYMFSGTKPDQKWMVSNFAHEKPELLTRTRQ